jgi:RHS repeat-associated protein
VLQARYSHGEEIDQPLSMARGGASYFYGVDHLGSVRLVTDAAGAVANRYDYDAFGNWEDTSYETVANPFGFTARERDAESGLMFYRARYYDPKLGRFISQDPIGFEAGDLNIYRYVFNGPVLLTDPTGNFATYVGVQLWYYRGVAAGAGVWASLTILSIMFNESVEAFKQDACSAVEMGLWAAAGIQGTGFALASKQVDPLGGLGTAIGAKFIGIAAVLAAVSARATSSMLCP